MLYKTIDELREKGLAGDWAFSPDDAWIIIRIPNEGDSRGLLCELPLRPEPDPLINDWQWDGNREAPTLTPSIHWVGIWHGYLRAGKLEVA